MLPSGAGVLPSDSSGEDDIAMQSKTTLRLDKACPGQSDKHSVASTMCALGAESGSPEPKLKR